MAPHQNMIVFSMLSTILRMVVCVPLLLGCMFYEAQDFNTKSGAVQVHKMTLWRLIHTPASCVLIGCALPHNHPA